MKWHQSCCCWLVGVTGLLGHVTVFVVIVVVVVVIDGQIQKGWNGMRWNLLLKYLKRWNMS